jgi:hypothetical protein
MMVAEEVRAMPDATPHEDIEQSPADWALIRQLILDALPDESVLETWSTPRAALQGSDPRRQNPPLRLVDMTTRTAVGPAMSVTRVGQAVFSCPETDVTAPSPMRGGAASRTSHARGPAPWVWRT